MIKSSTFIQEYKEKSQQTKFQLSYRQTNARYLALFFACLLMVGDAYCFDNPMALQSTITNLYGIDNVKFNLLYTVYSLPNIILPFFGGIFIDKVGARSAIIIFSTIVLIGQLVCAWGAYSIKFYLLIIGRVIFGMGSESLMVSQNTIMAAWFKNKEMSLAIGLCISIPKIGNALNSFVTPKINEEYEKPNVGLMYSMLAGAIVLIVSQIGGFCLIYMDKVSEKRERQDRLMRTQFIDEPEITVEKNRSMTKNQFRSMGSKFVEDESIQIKGSIQVKGSIPQPLHSQLIAKTEEQEEFDSPNLTEQDQNENAEESFTIFASPEENVKYRKKSKSIQKKSRAQSEIKEEINISDISKMSGTFWILIIICMLTEALFVPFLDNGNDLLKERYGYTETQAGNFLVIPYVVAAAVTPFLGAIADNFGRRSLLIIITSVVFLITHLMFLFVNCDGVCGLLILPLTCLGLCFGFYASIVIPSVPFVVKSQLIGTAYGLMGVFQNTALALFPLITGVIYGEFSEVNGVDNPQRGYNYFFVGMSILLVFIAILLTFVDKAGERKLLAKGVKQKIMDKFQTPQLQAREMANSKLD